MKLPGANPAAHSARLSPLPGRSNYFIGNDPQRWRTNIPNYGRVKYEQVYPGVDLVYYGTQGRLEYDFVVAPGADPSRIALQFEGAEARLAPDGDLLLTVAGGELCFRRPAVYQKVGRSRRNVTSSYDLGPGNRIGFIIGKYDRRRDLIIDPVLAYSSYLGGSTTDVGTAIAVDATGSAYITGQTISPDFPTKNPIETYHSGGTCVTGSPCPDVFVTKFNATGTALVYSTYLGGSSDDSGHGIALDSAKNAYVVGRTFSNDFPTTTGVLRAFCGEILVGGNPTSSCNGNFPDAFVTKLNASGSALLYSTFLGGTGNEQANAVAVDSAGDAYVVGTTSSSLPTGNPNDPGFPITGATALEATFIGGGQNTGFFVELNPAATSELYGTFLGTKAEVAPSTSPNGVAVDKSGKAYVGGYTEAADFPVTAGAFQTSCTPLRFGLCDTFRGFVSKFDPTQSKAASLVYSTYLGGTHSGAQDVVDAIAIDSGGDAYVTGQANSVDFPFTPGSFQTQCVVGSGICTAAYVTKFNPTGTGLVYSTFLGDQPLPPNTPGDHTAGYGIQVDAKKNAYVTGIVVEDSPASPQFPMVNPIETFGGIFVSKFNPAGNALLFSTHFGSNTTPIVEQGNAITIDSQGSAYITGFESSSLFTTTAGAFQTAAGGGEDAFALKIATVAADLALTNVAPTDVLSGSNLTYTITTTNDGPDAASTVSVIDNTPAGTTFVSVTTTMGSCTAPPVGGTGKVSCTASSLANAASITETLTVNVTASAGTTISDTAKVTSTAFDPNPKNNSATAKTRVH
jgi:uncharacterized repeat protein (TIGR01451 family)